MVAVVVAAAGCGGVDDDLSTEQQLVKLAGRPLTSTEIEEQLAMADLLCGFDERILADIWRELDARQLEFQDFVFGQRCPARTSFYAETRPDLGTTDATDPPTTTTTDADDDADRSTSGRGAGSGSTSSGSTTSTPSSDGRSTTTRPSNDR